MVNERIIIETILVDGAYVKAADRISKSTDLVARKIMALQKITMPLAQNYDHLRNMFDSNVGSMRKMNNIIKQTTFTFKQNVMAMLGVMFFGQMLSRTFSALLQPAMEVYGFFELWNALLLITMIPLMDLLLEPFLALFDLFISLPEPVQLAIGIFSALMVVLGSVLSVVGSLALGVNALLMFFGIAGPIMITGFIAALGPILLIAAAIIAVAALIYLAWTNNFGGIRDWIMVAINGIKQHLSGFVNYFSGLFKMIFSLFTGDVEGFKKAFFQTIGGLKDILLGLVYFVGSLAVTLGLALLNGMVNIIMTLGKVVADALWSILPNWFKRLLTEGASFVKSLFSAAGGEKGGEPKKFNDFIMRPGQAPISFSPQDTVIGAKDLGGISGGNGITINQTTNISALTMNEIQRMIDDSNRKLVDDVRRLVRV